MIRDNFYNSSFPRQKLPLSEKDKNWRESCVNYIISEGNVTEGRKNTRYQELQTYYDLYNSVFNEKDFQRITNPFHVKDGFPATPQDFNIIRPKVDLLIGEETKRPLNFKVTRTSQEAASETMDKEKELLMQYMQAIVRSRMSPEELEQYDQALANGEIMPPESIVKYMNKDYKDVLENTAYHTLCYLREKLALDNEFVKGWKDALIGGQEIYYVGILNSEPYVERVNPVYFNYDVSPDLEFIEDSAWCCRKMRMSMSEIYDRYFDKLSEKDLDKLAEMIQGVPARNIGEHSPVDDFNKIVWRTYDNPLTEDFAKMYVNVWQILQTKLIKRQVQRLKLNPVGEQKYGKVIEQEKTYFLAYSRFNINT